MSPEIYLLTIALPLLTAIVVFAMKYASAFAAARARLAQDGAIQALAESGDAHQAGTAASLKAIETELSRLAGSLSSIEAMLKEVG